MKKILIVEDEISIAELEKDYLEIAGYEVEIALTGTKGMKLIGENNYDLIILDLMLPGVSGFELCKEIRKTHNIPVFMVSARKEDVDKIRGLGLGADDYITKPFSPSELVARVKAHLAIHERLLGTKTLEKKINIRNLTINNVARRVLLNNLEVILTTKEYDLLYFLATNPDRVFTKEVLLNRIWGMDYYGDGATVTVHIGKLRDKIDKPNKGISSQFIETIWGVGYRFHV